MLCEICSELARFREDVGLALCDDHYRWFKKRERALRQDYAEKRRMLTEELKKRVRLSKPRKVFEGIFDEQGRWELLDALKEYEGQQVRVIVSRLFKPPKEEEGKE